MGALETLRRGGFGEDHVHDAVRIAATIHATALALEMEEHVTLEVPAPAAASSS